MKWSIWVIGLDGRGDPAGHWYRITPTSGINSFDSKAKAVKHRVYLCEIAANFDRKCLYLVEEFEDEHTKPEALESRTETLDSKPKVWRKGM